MAKSVRFARRKRSSFKKRRAQIGKKSKVARVRRSRRRVKVMRGGAGPKNILLIIDPQIGFCEGGPLAVPGATNDLNLLISFLQSNPEFFSEIHVSLDSHTNTHIAHKGFWKTDVAVFNELTLKDDKIVNGSNLDCKAKQIGDFDPTPLAKRYIELMSKLKGTITSDKPTPIIWPTHCIKPNYEGEAQSTEDVATGWALYEPLRTQLDSMVESKTIKYHEKGTNDLVEMYSIFSAEVPFKQVYDSFSDNYDYQQKIKNAYTLYFKGESSEENDVPDEVTGIFKANALPNYNTQFNLKLFKQLFGNPGADLNNVYICGEAKTHCVKTTIEDLYNTIQHGINNDDNVLRKAGYDIKNLKTILKNIHIIDNVSSSILGGIDAPGQYIIPMQLSFAEMHKNGVNFVEIDSTNAIKPSNLIRSGGENVEDVNLSK